MKVLMTAAPLVGHLTPLLPLAEALRHAGHQVLLATGGDALDVNTGFPVQSIAGPPRRRTALRVALAHPRLAVRDATGRAGIPLAGELFGGINNDGMADAAVTLARAWRPDLVVHEPLATAGALAAAVIGVPAVLHEINLWDPRALHNAVVGSRLFRHAMRRHRIDRLIPAADVSIVPSSLVGVRPGHRIRAIPSSGAGDMPPWLAAPGVRARILVSRSTTHTAPGGDPMRAVLEVAPHVDADFVLVRGPRDKALPSNVHVTGWIPLDRALRHATALVHHGGAGGLLQALAAGVPQLAMPGSADRRHNAELVAQRGAGLAVTAKNISLAVLDRLITDTDLRRAAEQVRAEIAGMPAPQTVVAALEATATSHRLER